MQFFSALHSVSTELCIVGHLFLSFAFHAQNLSWILARFKEMMDLFTSLWHFHWLAQGLCCRLTHPSHPWISCAISQTQLTTSFLFSDWGNYASLLSILTFLKIFLFGAGWAVQQRSKTGEQTFRPRCQTYQYQQRGAVIYPSGAVSTWAILCSLAPDGLGLVVSTDLVHWSPNVERHRPWTRWRD